MNKMLNDLKASYNSNGFVADIVVNSICSMPQYGLKPIFYGDLVGKSLHHRRIVVALYLVDVVCVGGDGSWCCGDSKVQVETVSGLLAEGKQRLQVDVDRILSTVGA